MAKAMIFTVNGFDYSAVPEKIDRKKLYGWRETIALGPDGNECTPASTADFGTLILPAGGIGNGIVSPEGEWVDRSSLVAVKADGEKIALLPSSYSITNPLAQTVSESEFLNYNITSVYQLSSEKEFSAAVGELIWTFPYRYRDSYESTAAFVLQSSGVVFMLLGVASDIAMIALDQVAVLDEENDNDETDEDEDIDFSLM
jgi:hypothetical protein